MNNINDIILAIRAGDGDAFRSLYDLYSERVYNTALSYMQDTHSAEEVTQEVFIKVFRKIDSFHGESALSTWIYKITINTALNHIKKNKRRTLVPLDSLKDSISDFEHPGVPLDDQENARLLFKVIRTLSENQKTAFILSYIEHLPQQEVADVMDLSLKAVESLLQRGKANLRKKLEKHYPGRRK